MARNYRQVMAIEAKNKKRLLEVNDKLNNGSGIYFLTRIDEDGIKYAYVGQAKHILSRLAEHLVGYQHIDLSLKKHGLYSAANPYGWKVNCLNYPIEQLDEQEVRYITQYAKNGWQMRNKTGGSQGVGKKQIDEFRPAKGYRDGIAQGRKNASREVAHLFDFHLEVRCKSDPPTKLQQNALDKFQAFLDEHKN